MAGFGYLCALVLAVVFVTAAGTKLARLEPVEEGFAALGLPAPVVLARVVPVAELAVAVLLVAAPRLGGIAAIGVLAVFTGVLGKALQAGAAAGCPCFGSVSARPVSMLDVGRNGLLALLGAAAMFTPDPVVPEPAEALAALAACTVGAAALAVARARQGRVRRYG